DGNGGCLIPNAKEVSAAGIRLHERRGPYSDAVAQTQKHGGRMLKAIENIGPHGFRAIVLDSEGNRIALHSTSDK
ncbi:MAG: VOC family protein, partial [Betaproteobacteria bacterium]|nr:VOC family protein [Betaproteobacteria bacterium]